MTEADKLFKKLGYEKHSSKTHERYDLYSADDEHLIRIVFNNKTRRLAIHCDGEALDMDEIKAINLKCKELGWIEE